MSLHPKYRADIDGLRAIGVLLVVAFHAYPSSVKAGFIGVDIFFVISGFLISTIILQNIQNNSFSFSDFYSRRISRIFPALTLILSSCLVFGWLTLLPDEFKHLGKHVAGGATFISNFLLWGESGYFDLSAETKPLLHLWSLGIEEQFYLLWPLLLWGVAILKIRPVYLIPTGILISFSLNIFGIQNNAIAVFYSPLTRFWELLIGSYLAWLMLVKKELIERISSVNKNIISFTGIALICIAITFITKSSLFPGWWALLPTLGTALIIFAGQNAWINKVVLSNRVFVWFGLISFPLYLWHWPILSFAQILEGEPTPIYIRGRLVLLSVMLAWLTYKFIEKPIRFGPNKTNKVYALIIVMCLTGISGFAIFLGYIPPRQNSPLLQKVIDARNESADFSGLSPLNYAGQPFYIVGDSKSETTVMLGNSHVLQYAPRILELKANSDKKLNTVIFATRNACNPIPNIDYMPPGNPSEVEPCRNLKQAALDLVKRENVKKVLIGGCWNCDFISRDSNLRMASELNSYYFVKDSKSTNTSNAVGRELALNELKELMTELSKTKRVYLLLDNPLSQRFDPESYLKGSRFGVISVSDSENYLPDNEEQLELRKQLIKIAKESNATVIDPANYLCKDGKCMRTAPDGAPIYRDSNHLRSGFVKKEAGFIDPSVLRD